MSQLAQIQAKVCAALNPACSQQSFAAATALLVPKGILDNPQRLLIYRHNVSGAHISVLQQIFPVCREIIGEDGFDLLARDYVWNCPTDNPDLNVYGLNFPVFLHQRLQPVIELPYLQDLAEFEYHWHTAVFAADDRPFDLAAFAEQAIPAEQLVFTLSQSLRLIQSEWPILELWQQHRAGKAPAELQGSDAVCFWVIVREGGQVITQPIAKPLFRLLHAMEQRLALVDLSSEVALQSDPGLLSELISNGWISDFHKVAERVSC